MNPGKEIRRRGGEAGAWPMRPALAKMAAAVRTTVGAGAVIAALFGAEAPVTWWWLVPALAVVTGWTAIYVIVAWRRGLAGWLVAADLLMTSALFVCVGHLVPAAALAGTENWVCSIASMAVVTAQLSGRPAVALPGGLLAVGSVIAGTRLAHGAGGGLQFAVLLATQGAIAAGVMAVAMRTERSAIRALSGLRAAEAEAAVSQARLEDERAQWRFVHNGPLTVLSMAGDTTGPPGGNLRQRAADVLRELPRLAGASGRRSGEVRLDERLAQVALWYAPPLEITADLGTCSVPEAVADGFAGAVGEVLENARRHSGTLRASVELRGDADFALVTVADEGRGFDPTRLRGTGSGVREGITGLMESVGGTAVVRSAPGAGTTVRLEWRRD